MADITHYPSLGRFAGGAPSADDIDAAKHYLALREENPLAAMHYLNQNPGAVKALPAVRAFRDNNPDNPEPPAAA